jgi:hypothetical protein
MFFQRPFIVMLYPRDSGGRGHRQIRHKIADRKINLVTDRRNNWYRGMKYCSCDNFFVEFP